MSSTADDSQSPPIEVPQSSDSVLDNKNNQEINAATQTSVTMTKTDHDLLGLGNDTPVKGAATGAPVVENSSDQIGVDENRYEIIYNFPPDVTILNVNNGNGRLRFELVTVRENGRLQIFMVPYRWPQLVRSPLRNGRLRMWLLNDDDQHGGGGEQVAPPQQGRDQEEVD